MDIEAVKLKYEQQLLGLPNVTGVGLGKKSGRKVIKVFVTDKVPEAQLQPQQIVPRMLDGFSTDVEIVEVVRVQAN